VALNPGTRLGPYELLEPLDRTVATKVLPGDLAADPQLKARFEREARAISAPCSSEHLHASRRR
jgi:hypothetical protein